MVKQKTPNPALGEKRKITKSELKERIEAKLVTRGVYDPSSATDDQLYQATVLAIKDIMLEYRSDFRKRIRAVDGKKVSIMIFARFFPSLDQHLIRYMHVRLTPVLEMADLDVWQHALWIH